MIILTGSTGYIGKEFKRQIEEQGYPIYCPSHSEIPFRIPISTDIIINCAAYIPHRSVSLCDQHPEETISGNLLLPMALVKMCESACIPLMTLSTACLFDEENEYSETDKPQRGFNGHCGIYVGTKLMMEKEVSKYRLNYILRIRLPFDEVDCDRNYLSKITRYPGVYDHTNSLTHRGDFVKAALDLWKKRCEPGIYHMANEGSISARDIIKMMKRKNIFNHEPGFIPGPSKGTRLSIKKLLDAGVEMRSVHHAVEDSISSWKK